MPSFDWTDTIVACATPSGVGPRAIVRVAGPETHAIVASLLEPTVERLPWRRRRLEFATFRLDVWRRSLDLTLYVWPEGQSYTGQAACELHFVSSPPIIAAVQDALIAAGARAARPGEFTLRAFLAGRVDLAQAEGVLGLIEAESLEQLRNAIDQRTGGLSRPVTKLRNDLVDLLADLEAGLDFAHEDIEFVAEEAVAVRLQSAMAELERLLTNLRSRSVELERPRVVLLGPPNAGKSSLFNALLGRDRSLTSSIPGTTRDVVSTPLKIGDRFVELIDTAGVDEAEDGVSSQAEHFREAEERRADLVLHCIPPGDVPPLDAFSDRILIVYTKKDLRKDASDDARRLYVSVVEPESIQSLKRAIGRSLEPMRGRDGLRSTTIRVRSALADARTILGASLEAHLESHGEEIVAGLIRQAIDHLGEVVGAVYTDDLLDRVFSRFCIGK